MKWAESGAFGYTVRVALHDFFSTIRVPVIVQYALDTFASANIMEMFGRRKKRKLAMLVQKIKIIGSGVSF